MENIIAALKDTPLPTILVVAGIAFLLLAVAGQLAGRIVVAPERQRWAAVIGGGLLALGVVLHVVPQDQVKPSVPDRDPTKEQIVQPSGVSPSTGSPPPTPEPILSLPTAGWVESYRIRTDYYGYGVNVEFSVFVNGVQVGDYSSGDAKADITRFIKPGVNEVRITWTADPNMTEVYHYGRLLIEVRQGEEWNPLITRQVTKTTKAGESTL
jgi:hypothetical protein